MGKVVLSVNLLDVHVLVLRVCVSNTLSICVSMRERERARGWGGRERTDKVRHGTHNNSKHAC